MQEVISRETVALPADLDSSSDQPVFIIDPASQTLPINDLGDIASYVQQKREFFGEDEESFKQYLEFLQICSPSYLNSDYFEGQDITITFKTSNLKAFKDNSLYFPIGFNAMMTEIADCSDKSINYFLSGYNFFLTINQLDFFKTKKQLDIFKLTNPYIFISNIRDQGLSYDLKFISENQERMNDLTKQKIKKKFKIFCSLNEIFIKIKKYEEHLRAIKKEQYPLVILSYETEQMEIIENSINCVKKDFERILKQFPDLELDLRYLETKEEDLQIEKWGKSFFINPYFLLIKFGQVLSHSNQKLIGNISKLDVSSQNNTIHANEVLRALVFKNYFRLKDFFYNYQQPTEIFSIEIPRIDDLLKDYQWFRFVFKHFHEFSKADCLSFSSKKFPKSYSPNILNFIVYCTDCYAFNIALASGVSLGSLENKKILELFLIGCVQSEEKGILDKEFVISFLLTYMNFGGDLSSSKKSLNKFLIKNFVEEKVKFEQYQSKLQSFKENLVKFRSGKTKLVDRKELLKELVGLSEQYLASFDLTAVSSFKDHQNHNFNSIGNFNKDFSIFKDNDFEEKDYSISSLLNFIGFIEYLNSHGIIKYCFESKVEDLEFEKDLELFKKNISQILRHLSSKSPIHEEFTNLSRNELKKQSELGFKSLHGQSLKRQLLAKQIESSPLLSDSLLTEKTAEKLTNNLEEKIFPRIEEHGIEKDKVEEHGIEESSELVKEPAFVNLDYEKSPSKTKQLTSVKDSQRFLQSCQEIYDRNHSLFLDIFNQDDIQDTISRFNEIYLQIEDNEKQVFVRSVYGYANMASLVIGEDFEHPLIVKAKELCNFLEREFPNLINGQELQGRDSSLIEVPSGGSLKIKKSQINPRKLKGALGQKSSGQAT